MSLNLKKKLEMLPVENLFERAVAEVIGQKHLFLNFGKLCHRVLEMERLKSVKAITLSPIVSEER